MDSKKKAAVEKWKKTMARKKKKREALLRPIDLTKAQAVDIDELRKNQLSLFSCPVCEKRRLQQREATRRYRKKEKENVRSKKRKSKTR